MSAKDLSVYLLVRGRELNLSVTELTIRTGISRQTWYRIQQEEVECICISTLVQFSRTLNVSPQELLAIYLR